MTRTFIYCCIFILSTTILLSGCGGEGGSNTNTSNTSKQPTSQPTKTDTTSNPATAYPLDTCIVTGEKLDSMGGAVTKVYEGQEVKFCCASCIKTFEKDQANYLAKIKEGKK